MVDVAVSEASQQKAAAAKLYIENMYRGHAQKSQDRRERCPGCTCQSECYLITTAFIRVILARWY